MKKENKKIDIILVQPNIVSPYKIYNLPFGPLFLASELKKEGYRVMIFDDRFDKRKDLVGVLRRNRIIFVGFTVFTGPNISAALELSKIIRNVNSSIPIVWGGPHPSILPEQTIRHPLIDIICRGEGGDAIVELADTLRRKGDLGRVRGITYEEGGKVVSTPVREGFTDWDRDVSMALDLIDMKKYIFDYGGLKTIHIITSKGCPFRCSFCWNLLCTKRNYMAWSSKKIEEEITPLLKAGVKRVIMNDAFMGPEKRIREIGELFKDLGLSWAIEDGFRVDIHAKESIFQLLKETGCHHASFGAESGSQRILDLIHKDITVEQILRSAELVKEFGLGGKYAWMIGIPHETREDALKTVRLIDKINHIEPSIAHSMSFFSPYPGTELYKEAVRMGWKPPQSLEEWGCFREEMSYPYLRNMWFYKSIMYSNFFIHATNSENAIWKQTRNIYSYVIRVLGATSTIRWKARFFSLPIEYMIGEYSRRYLKGWIET